MRYVVFKTISNVFIYYTSFLKNMQEGKEICYNGRKKAIGSLLTFGERRSD